MPNTHAQNERIKDNQQLRPRYRLIAVSERLREYQGIYGRSAIPLLNLLETEAKLEPVPWREHRVEAWKGIMSDRKITLNERRSG